MLAIDRLNKSFGALHVTRDVSIHVGASECHALIGPNGAGKTTLIHQISGVLKPDTGSVTLNGQDLLPLNRAQRAQAGLSRTFQITSILPSFSVLENVAIAIQAKSGSSFRFFRRANRDQALNEKAQLILQKVGLGGRADILASELSYGERRLVELAIALGNAPKFLLLDEPMAGLGRQESEMLIALLSTIKGQIPMLLIEHDMDAIFRLADRVSVLVEGKVVVTGTPEAIRNDPAARAAYLGEDAA